MAAGGGDVGGGFLGGWGSEVHCVDGGWKRGGWWWWWVFEGTGGCGGGEMTGEVEEKCGRSSERGQVHMEKDCDRGFGALVVIKGSLVLERRGGTTQRGTAATVSGDPTFERCGAAS